VLALAITLVTLLAPASALRQRNQDALPPALTTMIETEKAFAARALVIGWKRAFLEYFADDAIGFEEGKAGLAREQIAGNPDPPAGLRLLWEPRFGDVSASGELGYLTGPVQSILPSRNDGRPRHSNYASVWKRQRDGSFKVVMDLGIPTPSAVPYAQGFTRAPHDNRFRGDYDERTPPLSAADGVLNSGLRTSQTRAYRPLLADGARLHRPNVMPLVGATRILAWLGSQAAVATSDTRFSEVARSGDLGYTWGSYALRPRRPAGPRSGSGTAGRQNGAPAAEGGFYMRVWVRERSGQWKIALDVLSPQ
jgi:ketosteroid isomerase-like protein